MWGSWKRWRRNWPGSSKAFFLVELCGLIILRSFLPLRDEGNDLQAREKVIEHKTAELAAKSKDLEAVCEQLKTVQVVNDQVSFTAFFVLRRVL